MVEIFTPVSHAGKGLTRPVAIVNPKEHSHEGCTYHQNNYYINDIFSEVIDNLNDLS